MFSKACEYGIRAMLHIAAKSQKGERTSLADIAASTDSPIAFMAKILQKLVRAKLLLSMKGPGGGFALPPDLARQVRLSQIVSTIDGDEIYVGCALGMPHCDPLHPCPLHDKFASIRSDLRRMLENSTVEELTQGVMCGSSFLRRSGI